MNGGFLTDNELDALELVLGWWKRLGPLNREGVLIGKEVQGVVDRHRALVLQSHAPAPGTTGGRAETAPEDHPRSSGAEQRRWVTP